MWPEPLSGPPDPLPTLSRASPFRLRPPRHPRSCCPGGSVPPAPCHQPPTVLPVCTQRPQASRRTPDLWSKANCPPKPGPRGSAEHVGPAAPSRPWPGGPGGPQAGPGCPEVTPGWASGLAPGSDPLPTPADSDVRVCGDRAWRWHMSRILALRPPRAARAQRPPGLRGGRPRGGCLGGGGTRRSPPGRPRRRSRAHGPGKASRRGPGNAREERPSSASPARGKQEV